MVTELAILNVKDGFEESFEADFAIAGKYISAIKGYMEHSLSRCLEQKNKYILLVKWEQLGSYN